MDDDPREGRRRGSRGSRESQRSRGSRTSLSTPDTGGSATSTPDRELPPGLKRVDNDLVEFLRRYCGDEECDDELRGIIVSDLLPKGRNRLEALEGALGSPAMSKFIKGKLKDKLSQYYLPSTSPPITPPSPDLGQAKETREKERRLEIDMFNHLRKYRDSIPDEQFERIEMLYGPGHADEASGAAEWDDISNKREPTEREVRRFFRRLLRGPDVDMDDDDGWDKEHDEEGRREDAPKTEQLPLSTARPPLRPPDEDVDADEADRAVTCLKREGKEWMDDSNYKGSRQPPLGVRLEHVLNFLREEDVDRCINWESEFQEVVDYLEWLGKDDPDDQLNGCSLEVKNMYQDALAKVEIHREFEKFHYGTTPLKFQKTTLPKLSKRLDWVGCQRDHPMRLTSNPLDQTLPIRNKLTRPVKPVNILFPRKSEEGERFRLAYIRAEQAYWSDTDNEITKEKQVFLADNIAYEKFATEQIGWPLTDPVTGQKCLPDGTFLLPGNDYSTALERGARRAGLQQALRSFTAAEHAMTATPWRRVHLPLEHSQLERARRAADKNLHWEPFRLARGEMPLQLETAPYTYWWREHSKALTHARERARLRAVREHGSRRGWVNVPPNGSCGGPFVWRMVDPDVEAAQDLLRECETVLKMMEDSEARCGTRRRLMCTVNALCRLAADGEFGIDGNRQHDLVQLREEDWEPGQVGRRVRSVTSDEVLWLRFLSGKTTNPEMLVPLQGKGKLFRIFAKRVEKVMEDRSANAYFPYEESRLDLEDLLALVNQGCDGPVRKTKFSVTDAMCWLPRLDMQRRLIFREDLACYGFVVPSYQGLYPEHRIQDVEQWPVERWTPELGDIEPYEKHQTPPGPDDPTQSLLEPFVYNLGVRFGLTLYRLRLNQAEWSQLAPVSTRSLIDSMGKWSAVYDELTASDENAVPSLVELVRQANPMDYHDDMTEDEALKLIRAKMVEESAANRSMLGRGRRRTYINAGGRLAVGWVRDHNWGWASVRSRGAVAPRFWSLDRWPVAFQSERTARWIRSDAGANPRMLWDPRAEDSTADYPVRPKLRRYGAEEKVRFRPGRAIYSIGDTPLQQRVIRDRITEMAAEAMGIDKNQRTWGERLAGFFRTSSAQDDMPGEPQLPKIDPSLMPVSWDPQSMPEAQQDEVESENVGSGHGSPGDVEMAGA